MEDHQHNSPENKEFFAAFQQLVGAIFRLNGQLLETADRMSADLDISTGRWQAIATIRHQPLTVSQIARRVGVTRQSARKTVQKLQEAGFVELRVNPDHRRASLVALSDAGRALMNTLFQRQEMLTLMFTDGLEISSQSVQELARQLDAFCEQASINAAEQAVRSGRQHDNGANG